VAKQVSVVVTCDLDSNGTLAVGTAQFGYDGWTYSLDLCADHLAQFNESIGGFAAVASKSKDGPVTRRRASKSAAPAGGRPSAPSRVVASAESREDREALRDWARSHGYEVGGRGRIGASVRAAYAEAKAADASANNGAVEGDLITQTASPEPVAKVAKAAKKSTRRRSTAKKAAEAAAEAPAKASRTGKRPAKRAATAGPSPISNIRTWAQENGFTIGNRGRIPATVRQAYEAAIGASPSEA
jgi:Lsr2